MFRKAQRGLGAIAAIVILVMLAGLAAFMANLSSSQQVGSSLDVQGVKAFAAAQSGVEWALYQSLKSSSCAASTDLGALDGMNVTVTCSATAVTEQGSTANIYAITSTACNLPTGSSCPGNTTSPLYVERRVTALTEK
jgi:MSHA biogenesis protein MshP